MPMRWRRKKFFQFLFKILRNALYTYRTKEMYILAQMWYTKCCCIRASKKSDNRKGVLIWEKIFGHSSMQISMNLYVYVTEEEKKKEIELVAEVLNLI